MADTRAQHASLLSLSLAIIALIVVMIATTILLRPSYFMNGAEALGLGARFGAFASFIARAIGEEAAKAGGIGVADLRRSRFSWFWITVIVAGAMGLIEFGLRVLLYLDRIGAGAYAISGLRTVAGHIALSLLCVVLARWTKNWIGAVAVVGILHAAVNYARMQTGLSIPYLVGTGLVFAAVIAAAYIWRARFDWRCSTSPVSHP